MNLNLNLAVYIIYLAVMFSYAQCTTLVHLYITTVTLNHVFFDSNNITGVTLPFLFKKLSASKKEGLSL